MRFDFLVCKATQELIDESTEGLFKSSLGAYFMYKIAYTEEDTLTITDSIGRTLPMDCTEIEQISEILARITRFQKARSKSDEQLLYQLVNTPANSLT